MKRDINIKRKVSKKRLRLRNEIKEPKNLPKILLIATYPPRECGIATYTNDLKNALENKFEHCFDIKICALDSSPEVHTYQTEDIYMVLNINDLQSFSKLANKINSEPDLEIVMIQHEFGLFKNNEDSLINFMKAITKPIIITFHTVLPNPNEILEKHVKELVALANTVTVMTKSSAELLRNTYGVDSNKIKLISHGTHLVKHQDKSILKEKHHVSNRKVISTFGFLGPGKNIETTLEALPEIIKEHHDIMFFIVGKTHPTLFNEEGDAYMDFLRKKVEELKLNDHVRFINKFVPLPELLEYLQLSDCYLFTSKDPNQAVSGTFSYAVSCGCPIISTPIPHAREVLSNGNGTEVLFDFGDSKQLAHKVIDLLNNDDLRHKMKMKELHTAMSTSWENSAISHALIFSEEIKKPLKLKYKKPPINLKHLEAMTTDVGIIQFSKINTPDIGSGYTLDDNARALIAACDYYKITQNPKVLKLARTYINFILKCQRDNGLFLNYVNEGKKFTKQNNEVNLEDSNGRAIWALGYAYYLMEEGIDLDITLLQNMTWSINYFNQKVQHFKSPRALAFVIKGLCFFNLKENDIKTNTIINDLANKLAELYAFHAEKDWNWFEPYLTYANSVLPESLLYAWKATGNNRFKHIAKESFDFLLSKIFKEDSIRVISNQNWLIKGFEDKSSAYIGGEQPIDVAYTILALKQFNRFFPFEGYDDKMEIAFSWFLGNNQLKQIVYNPCTGGCHDGLEEHNVNLNQGAESTVSYLLSRCAFEDIV
ncbi:Spore coat protein SA [Mariniflexile rhizosphaerae]|uniref:glycosyltransferase n=1 Tax=unclassified Mariniflexile TaxID=2643887 RepID=UPI000CA75172|nr:glycosyltransferase [Mariniflexile sp. TRM1-10]AXP81819.1 Spore coat protein SA [Mariniflexile sp. TRM1-10]PLB20799.1 MAG: Glycosyl transferase family 1 [Flavobacteriaceae bacterium FS1-H7996/R]